MYMKGARGIAQQLRALAVLVEDLGSFQERTPDSSLLSVASVPGVLVSSSLVNMRVHGVLIQANKCTHIHIKKNKYHF